MSTDMSMLHLILNASVIVQFVMLLLLAASFFSWVIIFDKYKTIKQATSDANDFEDRFWSGGDVNSIYNEITRPGYTSSGMEIIFEAGFSEYMRLRKQSGVDPMDIVEGAQRAMRVALSRQIDELDTRLSFLATVGSTSPYVGLFGTVWGIMNSFRSLGSVQQATLSLVAPGIAEALVATAMGLFAAIPAVISYNSYAHDTERLANRYDAFLEEFSTILQRQAHA